LPLHNSSVGTMSRFLMFALFAMVAADALVNKGCNGQEVLEGLAGGAILAEEIVGGQQRQERRRENNELNREIAETNREEMANMGGGVMNPGMGGGVMNPGMGGGMENPGMGGGMMNPGMGGGMMNPGMGGGMVNPGLAPAGEVAVEEVMVQNQAQQERQRERNEQYREAAETVREETGGVGIAGGGMMCGCDCCNERCRLRLGMSMGHHERHRLCRMECSTACYI